MKIFIAQILILLCFFYARSQDINGIVLSDTGSVTVVKVWGTHQERAYAHGYLLGNGIKAIYDGYFAPLIGSNMDAYKTIIEEGTSIKIDPVFHSEAQAMIQGMADAGVDTTGTDYLELLVANSFLDLMALPGKSSEKKTTNGCSSLMSWGEATAGTDLDGASVISRHVDWYPAPALTENQVIIIHIPSEADEQPWLLIGFAGQISVLSGISSSGLSAFQHMMSDFSGSSALNMAFEPVWFTLRRSLEKTDINDDGYTNINDIKYALAENTNGYADGYLISALAPSTAGHDSLIAMVAEVAPETPLQVYRGNEYNDSIPSDNLYTANAQIKRNDMHNYCDRYLAVINAIGNGLYISSEKNLSIMKDHSNGQTHNVQFMQHIPEQNILKLAVYYNSIPAYQNIMVSYDLTDLFAPVTEMQNSPPGGQNINVFPNPFDSSTVFHLPEKQNSVYDLRIMDIKGKTLLEENNITGKTYKLNRKHLKPGVYIYKFTDNKNNTYQGKIVIL